MSIVSVIVRIQLSAESAPAYAEAAKAVVAATREEAGCQCYGIAVDIADPCVLWVSEQWASQADLDAHLKTPHVAAFLEACAALEILDMEVDHCAFFSCEIRRSPPTCTIGCCPASLPKLIDT